MALRPAPLDSNDANGYGIRPGSNSELVMPVRRLNTRNLVKASAERTQTAIRDIRVSRVLTLLSEQNLTAAAAEQSDTPGLLTIESVDLPHVWEDDRIVARVAELATQEIGVEAQQIEKAVAGMTFKCWAILVRY